MNRRTFFRLLAGAGAWMQTKHVAWAFPQPIQPIPLHVIMARIRITKEVMEDARSGVFLEAIRQEQRGLTLALQRDMERRVLAAKRGYF